MPFQADLHCHSTHSDGTLSPEELVQHAVDVGLQGLAITDHDTVTAYNVAYPLAKKLGLLLIPGVEFSAVHKNTSIHILGYSYDPKSPAIHQLCERHISRREERNAAILEELAKHDMPLKSEEIPRSLHTTGRPHIAQAMVKKGYVASIQEAFFKYIGDDKKCYVRTACISVEETIDVIHKGGGLAVIAHPHLIPNPKATEEILEMPFDGIECIYANFSNDKNRKWIKIAKKKGLLMTGGSDFHGSIKPQTALGASTVGEELFQHLYQHYQNNEVRT